MTALLQSSTATGLMMTSFAARGFIDLAPALAVMLGANIGTTLIVQAFSFDILTVAPILFVAGLLAFILVVNPQMMVGTRHPRSRRPAVTLPSYTVGYDGSAGQALPGMSARHA